MTVGEVRKRYIEFFKSGDRAHKEIPSASLVPENDPTTLFTSSGMQPLVPYLLGQAHPLGKRLVNSQKSFRAEDMEEVGDNRHTTFFEMLGNWSLGDYFKKEQLPWFFEFLTNQEIGLGLRPENLYVSVFQGDESNNVPKDIESAEIWQNLFKEKGVDAKIVELGSEARGGEVGMQDGRIFYYDAKKNWWSRSGVPANMPAGEPGGPDSEVFYEFTHIEHDNKFGAHCHPNCDCGRFMEIGNSVFMEYRKREDGTFEKLPQHNVDFGGGLERMAAATMNEPDVFKIDVFQEVIASLEKNTKREYSWHKESFRVLADHLRAAVFLMSDGVRPSNKSRGYVLRKLIRKAVFVGYKDFGITGDVWWIGGVADALINIYGKYYENIKIHREEILNELNVEAKKFYETLETGIKIFNEIVAGEIVTDKSKVKLQYPDVKDRITGEEAFLLFTTHGFPIELVVEMASQIGLTVDLEDFESRMRTHQDLSRTASAGVFKGGLADHSETVVKLHTATHLMNAALRKVLGENVWQKGSNITPERTRFDFTHNEKMTDAEKQEVERIVNEWIAADYEVKKEMLPIEEARKLGATGVFGEKYPDIVSVYTVWDEKNNLAISREFCGGPHVEHTGVLGHFRIQKEEASSAGVRRIKAVLE